MNLAIAIDASGNLPAIRIAAMAEPLWMIAQKSGRTSAARVAEIRPSGGTS
jgi:hypothetical protein